MKKNILIKKILFSVFAFTLASCSVEWNGDLLKGLNDDAYVSVEYIIDDSVPTPVSFTEQYLKGSLLSQEKIPQADDSRVLALKPGYTLQGWNIDSAISPGSMTELSSNTIFIMKEIDGTDERLVKEISLTDFNFRLKGLWTANLNTPYKINFYLESLSNPTDFVFKDSKTLFGKTDSTVTLDSSDYSDDFYGFELSDIDPASQSIKGDGSSVFNIIYDRTEFTIYLFNNTDDNLEKATKYSGKYESSVPSVETWYVPTKSGYILYGWTSDSSKCKAYSDYNDAVNAVDKTFPTIFDRDYYYYAVFGPQTYEITLKDQFGKPLSGTYEGGNSIRWDFGSDNYYFDVPTNSNPNMKFAGWYLNNPACNDGNSKLSSIASGTQWELERTNAGSSKNITLYAKWEYSELYLDPLNGSDDNKGDSLSSAVKTVEQARKYTYQTGGQIVLLSPITKAEDISNLSNLDESSISIRRYTTTNEYTYPFINFAGTMDSTTPLAHITLDGGAKWSKQSMGPYEYSKGTGTNDGKTSSTALIINSGTMYIGENVEIRNNHNTKASGGGIYNTGELIINGPSAFINYNYAAETGGGIYSSSAKSLTIKNAIISNNYATGTGGGLYIYNTTANLEHTITDTNIWYNASNSTGGGLYATSPNSTTPQTINLKGSNTKVSYNIANSSGGGIYIYNYTTIKAEDCSISDNEVTTKSKSNYGGGIAFAAYTDAEFTNVTVSGNKAFCGGGISLSGTNAKLILNTSTVIKNNDFVTKEDAENNGKGVYVTAGYLWFNGGYVDQSDDVYTSNSNPNKIRIMNEYSGFTSNYGVLAVVTPSDYSGDKVLVRLENMKVTNTLPAVSDKLKDFFKIINDSAGKKYYVDTDGKLKCTAIQTESGGIQNPLEGTITCSFDGNYVTITYKKEGDSTETPIEPDTFTATLYFGNGVQTTTTWSGTYYAPPEKKARIIIPATYPAGLYRLEVTGTYKGKPFLQTFELTQ